MDGLFLSPLGNKAQVTLPKAVREALGGVGKSDLVGFIVEGRRVAVTRIEPVPSSDPFTEEEWARLRKLAAKPPAAVFDDSKSSLRYLRGRLVR